ncbi:peptide/nickel transport system ATP-binding protein [Pelomonas aquatica]|uniref:Peptide/nickel transport system ATP-binding protein n=1 Tax=Pelomonas aquatica TaxID=431058 RepID=A0ABU1ZEJ5_9BURK|nr:ABC transporter ATP-binding protein [Pelomonas aquatica]MDR7299051.1 peptide/nickel transport system ATP-binding protein [Pelomonas aquatica]
MTTAAPLLQVQGLQVAYGTPAAPVPVVRGVSFTLGREKLAVVGESGSGKTTVGRALLKLLPQQARISAERLQFDGVDLLQAGERDMQALRGRRLSMIMQDPKYSLNPVMSIGRQIGEAVQRDGKVQRAECDERVEALLARVRIREPKRVAAQYPHEVSGGMGQRVMIAMMLAQRPQLLIADEPTSALDVSVRQEVLGLLDELVAEQGLALLFISHDLNLVKHFCDRVLVMYAGRIVETLAAADLRQASHPYTRGLMASLPSLRHPRAVLPVLQRDAAWSAA